MIYKGLPRKLRSAHQKHIKEVKRQVTEQKIFAVQITRKELTSPQTKQLLSQSTQATVRNTIVWVVSTTEIYFLKVLKAGKFNIKGPTKPSLPGLQKATFSSGPHWQGERSPVSLSPPLPFHSNSSTGSSTLMTSFTLITSQKALSPKQSHGDQGFSI